jgi:hypothetical protein
VKLPPRSSSLLQATARRYPPTSSCLVQFLIELVKLRGLCHDVFLDEKWRLDFLVSIFAEEVKGICDEGLVKIDAIICEEVASIFKVHCI